MKTICLVSSEDHPTELLANVLSEKYHVVMYDSPDAVHIHPDLMVAAGTDDFYHAYPILQQFDDIPVLMVGEYDTHFSVLMVREFRHAACRRTAHDGESLLRCISDLMEDDVVPPEVLLPSSERSCLQKLQAEISSVCSPDNFEGAMQVDFRNFGSIYRFVEKLVSRSGLCVQTLLLTLLPRSSDQVTPDDIRLAMETLTTAVHLTLRKNDVLTGCGCTQMLVLLMDADDDGGHLAANRIMNVFLGMYDTDLFELHYDIGQVGCTK